MGRSPSPGGPSSSRPPGPACVGGVSRGRDAVEAARSVGVAALGGGAGHSRGRAGRAPLPWTCARAPPPPGTPARSTAAAAAGRDGGVTAVPSPGPRRAAPRHPAAHLQREAGLPLAVAVVRVAHGGQQAVHHAQVQHLLRDAYVAARQDPGPGIRAAATLGTLRRPAARAPPPPPRDPRAAPAWLAASPIPRARLPPYPMALAAAACCKNTGRWAVSWGTKESGGEGGREATGPASQAQHPRLAASVRAAPYR